MKANRRTKIGKTKRAGFMALVVVVGILVSTMAFKQITRVYAAQTKGAQIQSQKSTSEAGTMTATTQSKSSVTARNSRNTYGISSQTETLITGYLTSWFDALAGLKEQDLTQYFDLSDSSGAVSAGIDQTALGFLVEVRAMQQNDLTMTQYECGITYTGASTLDNGDTEITLLEDHQVNFSFIKDTESASSGIAHSFVIRKEGNEVAIISHEKEEDGYLMVEERYAEESEGAVRTQTSQILDNIKAELLSSAEKNINALNAQKSEADSLDEESGDGTYDREAAVAYAMEWVDPIEVVRNDAWTEYDDYGGNCNNYISQCLYAGGIPMDSEGENQWKWYGEAVNTRQTNSGRSGSWAGVEDFYDYAQSNTGTGLNADTTANVYLGEAGDVLQYGTGTEWNHSVIITDRVTDSSGQFQDYLINSNTTDRINYPASAYAYSDLRLIKVLGGGE